MSQVPPLEHTEYSTLGQLDLVILWDTMNFSIETNSWIELKQVKTFHLLVLVLSMSWSKRWTRLDPWEEVAAVPVMALK